MKNCLWALGLILSFSVTPALAHPHIFADAKVVVLFDEKGFVGIRNRWSFDELYSAAMMSSGDADGDGKISDAESVWFRKAVLDPLQEKNYLNYVQFGASFLKVRKLKDFRASFEGNHLVFYFETEFGLPVSAEYAMLVAVITDLTNYIQINTDMENADVDAPDSIDVEYFSDGLEGLSLFKSFVYGGEGLFLRFKKK